MSEWRFNAVSATEAIFTARDVSCERTVIIRERTVRSKGKSYCELSVSSN